MTFFLGVVGLVFGTIVRGFWGAAALGVAGVWVGNWINRTVIAVSGMLL